MRQGCRQLTTYEIVVSMCNVGIEILTSSIAMHSVADIVLWRSVSVPLHYTIVTGAAELSDA
jgi:hypothetical protein